MIDRFLCSCNHVTRIGGKIKGRCQPPPLVFTFKSIEDFKNYGRMYRMVHILYWLLKLSSRLWRVDYRHCRAFSHKLEGLKQSPLLTCKFLIVAEACHGAAEICQLKAQNKCPNITLFSSTIKAIFLLISKAFGCQGYLLKMHL